NALMASVPLAKRLTLPAFAPELMLNAPVFTGETRNALPPSCQFVGQLNPFEMLTGKPLVNRNNPESCQPPITASTALFAFPATSLARPNGSSTIQLALNW